MSATANPETTNKPGFARYDVMHLLAGFVVFRIAGATGLLGWLAVTLASVIPGLELSYAIAISAIVFIAVGVVASYFWLVPPIKSIKSKSLRRSVVVAVLIAFALILGLAGQRPV